VDTGEHPAGKVFKVDPNPLPVRNETYSFRGSKKDFLEIFLAEFINRVPKGI